MIMNEKLKKIALKLSKKYKSSSVYEAYIQFMGEVSANRDYFGLYSPEQLVKIPIYIFSKNETGNFELGDNMIKNAWIGNVFEFGDGDYYVESCDSCAGDGYETCQDCDNGNVDCDNCDGHGKVDCEACDGVGEDEEGDSCSECNGHGQVDCDDCDGVGYVECRNCGGDGSYQCGDCDGKGDIETDSLNYMNKTVIVWDRKLINMFMNSYELEKPMSNQDILPFINQSMMSYLDVHEDVAEFKTDVKSDTMYCFYFEQLLQGGLKLSNNQLTTGKRPNAYIYQ